MGTVSSDRWGLAAGAASRLSAGGKQLLGVLWATARSAESCLLRATSPGPRGSAVSAPPAEGRCELTKEECALAGAGRPLALPTVR